MKNRDPVHMVGETERCMHVGAHVESSCSRLVEIRIFEYLTEKKLEKKSSSKVERPGLSLISVSNSPLNHMYNVYVIVIYTHMLHTN